MSGKSKVSCEIRKTAEDRIFYKTCEGGDLFVFVLFCFKHDIIGVCNFVPCKGRYMYSFFALVISEPFESGKIGQKPMERGIHVKKMTCFQ